MGKGKSYHKTCKNTFLKMTFCLKTHNKKLNFFAKILLASFLFKTLFSPLHQQSRLVYCNLFYNNFKENIKQSKSTTLGEIKGIERMKEEEFHFDLTILSGSVLLYSSSTLRLFKLQGFPFSSTFSFAFALFSIFYPDFNSPCTTLYNITSNHEQANLPKMG